MLTTLWNRRPACGRKMPRICDLCHAHLGEQLVEGKTLEGYRAVMCLFCSRTRGVGVGFGNGTLYERIEGQMYRRIEG